MNASVILGVRECVVLHFDWFLLLFYFFFFWKKMRNQDGEFVVFL